MINLKNKPITLFIAAPILGFGLILGAGYVVYMVVKFLLDVDKMGITVVVFGPLMLWVLLQSIAYLAVGFFILRAIYKWSTAGIILNIFATPLAFLAVVVSVASYRGSYMDFSSPVGIGSLLFFFLGSFALALIAYNDIKYRKKSLFSQIN